MKSVLISIRPYWVFLIIAKTMGWNTHQRKLIEVRKDYPKAKSWNKVAKVYCSKDKRSFAKIPKEYQPLMEQFLGKVIGEFVCDKVEHIEIRHFTVFGHENRYAAVGEKPDHQWLAHSCLTYDEVARYGKMAPLYGWHITNLQIYDKPKELSAFRKTCVNDLHCEECGMYSENSGICGNGALRLTRPPQSWCYVEELNDKLG